MKEKNRLEIASTTEARREGRAIAGRIRLASPDIVMTDALRDEIGKNFECRNAGAQCLLMRIGPERYLLVSTSGKKKRVSSSIIDLAETKPDSDDVFVGLEENSIEGVDLAKARIELRPVQRRQLYVDGKPFGAPIE